MGVAGGGAPCGVWMSVGKSCVVWAGAVQVCVWECGRCSNWDWSRDWWPASAAVLVCYGWSSEK